MSQVKDEATLGPALKKRIVQGATGAAGAVFCFLGVFISPFLSLRLFDRVFGMLGMYVSIFNKLLA